MRFANGFLTPSPWPSPARGEGTFFSSVSITAGQGAGTSCLLTSVPDPCFPSPLAGEVNALLTIINYYVTPSSLFLNPPITLLVNGKVQLQLLYLSEFHLLCLDVLKHNL